MSALVSSRQTTAARLYPGGLWHLTHTASLNNPLWFATYCAQQRYLETAPERKALALFNALELEALCVECLLEIAQTA